MGLNWETYKKLTPELQKEYDFRFSNPPYAPLKGLGLVFGIMTMTVITLMFTMYMVVREPALAVYKTQLATYMQAIAQTAMITGYVIAAMLLQYVVEIIVYLYQFYKWKKNNNIKEVHWWSKWLNKTKTS